MEGWSTSMKMALADRRGEVVLAIAFLVPAVATAGQYWATGFWAASTNVAVLFWPGQAWHWTVRAPVWIAMGAMLASYLLGIAWLIRRRTFGAVALASVAAIVAANLVAAGINGLTGWRELQTVASMNLAGKVNQAIFSLWHNPAWEELVFRGLPLLFLLAVTAAKDRAPRWALYSYYLVPSLVFAWYHVPGHGPSRLADTFILSLAFAWMARRYTFFAPLVMHYIFDAVMTMSLPGMGGIPANEVTWLAAHSGVLNTTWSVALLLWFALMPALVLRRRRQARVDVAVRT